MSKSIRLSPQHGVNPSVMTCFYCGEAKGVALLGHIKGDKAAPRAACFDVEPCDTCAGHMKAGVLLISVRDGESGPDPYRTGGWCVIKEEALARILNNAALIADIAKKRVAFLPDQVWDAVGLPRGEQS